MELYAVAMSDSSATDGSVIVNVFTVEPSGEKDGLFQDPQFLKRGWMPISMIQSMYPLFIDARQYEWVEACYDLGHREVMAFVRLDEREEKVAAAAKATVPDNSRYGASAH